ncbi:MAG TPA: glycerol-3-phosphate ABC transporter ATP-binding protein [Chloroflexi bacterium]|nr:glycerol-3-phosphate ABC transporter ATP-binding protein [Chloroflexota bacterium]
MARVEYEDVWKQFAAQGAPAVRGLSLDIADGELLVLLGPSGCGKTTALRMLAGLEEPDRGDIRIAGTSVVGREPKDRDVALVFQSYALYPHLSARENIRYPLKLRKMSRAEQDKRVDHVADMLGIAHLLPRRPAQLSGGEQQRVALARAIVREPRVFLMDEPLSNLDAKLRVHTRTELKTLQRQLETTMVFVTHDQAEAMSLANRIAILSAGELQQIGTPDDVYDHPANLFVAEFIGSPPMNLLEVTRDGDTLVAADGWRLPAPLTRDHSARELTVGLRPEAIAIGTAGQAAEVVAVEPLGSEVIVDVRVGEKALKVRAAPAVRPQPGSTVHLAVEPGAIRLFDRSSGSAFH